MQYISDMSSRACWAICMCDAFRRDVWRNEKEKTNTYHFWKRCTYGKAAHDQWNDWRFLSIWYVDIRSLFLVFFFSLAFSQKWLDTHISNPILWSLGEFVRKITTCQWNMLRDSWMLFRFRSAHLSGNQTCTKLYKIHFNISRRVLEYLVLRMNDLQLVGGVSFACYTSGEQLTWQQIKHASSCKMDATYQSLIFM